MTVHVDLSLVLPRPVARPIVIGVDPSLTNCGIASSHGWLKVVSTPSPKKTDITWATRKTRIERVRDDTLRLCAGAALVVIEGPSYRSVDFSAFDRAHLWWEIYDALLRDGLPVAVMAPASRMQYATGKGQAAKLKVFEAAKDRLGGVWESFEASEDLADAAWLCCAGAEHLGVPLVELPKTHRAALAKVAWPAAVTS